MSATLITIPRELRDMIYDLTHETKRVSKDGAEFTIDLERTYNPAILRVCKQMYHEYGESAPMSKSTLHITLDHISESHSDVLQLKTSFDPARLNGIKTCNVNLTWLHLNSIVKNSRWWDWADLMDYASEEGVSSLQSHSATPTKVIRDKLLALLSQLRQYLSSSAMVNINVMLDGYDPTTKAECPSGSGMERSRILRKIFHPAALTEMMSSRGRQWPEADKLQVKFFTRTPLYYNRPSEAWRSCFVSMKEIGFTISTEAEPSSTMVEWELVPTSAREAWHGFEPKVHAIVEMGS